jgi:UPF0042 nucleotide-binding protein
MAARHGITITSFGYGHPESPPSAHITVDVRNLFRDPHVDPAMRQMTGLDQAVIDSVMRQPGALRFVTDLARTASGLSIVHDRVHMAVGCVGGRHRSVVIADRCGAWLEEHGYRKARVVHRDIRRPVLQRATETEGTA